MIRSRESGAGTEFLGTRPYVDGDPPRHINWKASARWERVITNLFEQERMADIGIVLDARNVAEVNIGAMTKAKQGDKVEFEMMVKVKNP